MLFAIDIDQTISTGYAGKGLRESIAYYEAKGIKVPAHITKYPELFQLLDVLRLHDALPGAVAGVHELAKHGHIAYYTVRKHDDPQANQDIQGITRTWLAGHGFPCPNNVVFCRSVMHKLLRLHEEDEDALVLIDDHCDKAFTALGRLAHSEDSQQIADDLSRRLTMITFGAPPFHDWHCVIDLLAFIRRQQGGTTYA